MVLTLWKCLDYWILKYSLIICMYNLLLNTANLVLLALHYVFNCNADEFCTTTFVQSCYLYE